MQIHTNSGNRLRIAGNVKASPSSNGLLLSNAEGWVFAPITTGNVIDTSVAQNLVEMGLALYEGDSVFENEALSKSVFNWSVNDELTGLLSVIPQEANCLDVGCGFGRLLQPMAQAGRNIVGVDRSLAAVLSLARNGYEVICAPIEDFCRPGFSHAFAALNTLRYLETWFAWNRHFDLMRHTLNVGGKYLVNLSLVEEPHRVVPLEWSFLYNDAVHRVSWKIIGFDRLDDTIVEQVFIMNPSGAIVHSEYQIQLWVTPKSMGRWLASNSPHWQLTRVWDNHWTLLDLDSVMNSAGTYWIELQNR